MRGTHKGVQGWDIIPLIPLITSYPTGTRYWEVLIGFFLNGASGTLLI